VTAQEALARPHLAKLRVRDFLLLAEAGAFDDYPRTELIEGEIWVVQAIHSRHARAHAALTGELFAALKELGSELTLYTAPSTELSDDSMLEPDIALAESDDAKTVQGLKVRIAVEISDSSLAMDMGRKRRLYARHGIPEYWVADLDAGVIQQMWAAAGEDYAERREVAFGEVVEAATIAGLKVETGELR